MGIMRKAPKLEMVFVTVKRDNKYYTHSVWTITQPVWWW